MNPKQRGWFWIRQAQHGCRPERLSIEPSQKLFTVGHSTRTIDEFVDLLRSACVDLVADVRSIPKSRRNPDYNLERLPGLLQLYQIGHVYLPELGGRRPRMPGVPAELNGYWENQSFHNYADYALSDDFAEGMRRLLGIAEERRCAIMCSEAVWWRCHRRIIADYALVRGWLVSHLMGVTRIVPATLTPGAQARDLLIFYPAADTDASPSD
ncbi:MAG: hypothetical protein QOH04_3242 [Sphingomonadales bacterium]|nr:hypothetical protein [Sphingomonadales bacterium]